MSNFTTHQDYLASLPIERQQRIKEKTERLKQAMQNNELIDLAEPTAEPITINIDKGILAWLKKDNQDIQSRINALLAEQMKLEMI